MDCEKCPHSTNTADNRRRDIAVAVARNGIGVGETGRTKTDTRKITRGPGRRTEIGKTEGTVEETMNQEGIRREEGLLKIKEKKGTTKIDISIKIMVKNSGRTTVTKGIEMKEETDKREGTGLHIEGGIVLPPQAAEVHL